MANFRDKNGTLNPFRINEYNNLKAELLTQYSNINSLDKFKDFLSNNTEITEDIVKYNPLSQNKEIIDYAFIQDKITYGNKVVKSVIDYAHKNNDIDLLKIVKDRHINHLKNKEHDISELDIKIIKFYAENDLINLTEVKKGQFAVTFLGKSDFEKLELFNCKEYILDNSFLLNLDSTKKLMEHYKVDNEQLKKLYLGSFNKKGNCEENTINVFMNSPVNQTLTKDELENGGYGEDLLTDRVKYFTENFNFDEKTLKEAFDLSVKNQNLETAKYLLENNEFQPKISTMIEIQNKYPRLNDFCKKLQLKKDFEVKYQPKNNINNHGLKI